MGPLRVLIADDSQDDALLLVRVLRQGGYDVTSQRVDTPLTMGQLLSQETWDLVVADYSMPEFSAREALRMVHDSGLDLPCIVVSGVVNEEVAVEVMKAGAHDFMSKDKLNRLVPAVTRELGDAAVRLEARRAAAGQRLLTEAGAILIASLDYADTLLRASHVAIPTIADHCHIDIRGDDGIVRRVAVADTDADLEMRLREVAEEVQPDWDAQDPCGLDVASADSMVTLPGLLIIPLSLRGTAMGAISFVMTSSGRQYQAEDISLAQGLARRITMALDNARSYAAEQHARADAEEVALDNARLFASERRAHAEAEAAIRTRDEFLSIASHELRTPVTAIKCTAQLLLSSFGQGVIEPEQVVHRLQMVNAMSERLNLLIGDLLDVSRLRTGQLRLRPVSVDLGRLAGEMVDQYRVLLGSQYPLALTITGTPGQLSVDPHRIQQTLSNVLENALKYSPDGGRIDVTVHAEGSGVLMTVVDRGIGLPPEAARTIFEPFGRGANAQKRQVPGMGLGLYIARQIVEQHGGRIWAESDGEGCGTVVSIWLPSIVRKSVVVTAMPRRTAGNARSRVLVVEDERPIREVLGDALGLEGYECRLAANGHDALSMLDQWPADVIVLDLMMPIMDGWTFRREQRANPALRNIPIVVVSASPLGEGSNDELDAAAIVGKPFELDYLLRTLARVVSENAPASVAV
jgi:signal transduction histidine kinase/DNA-binding response OmpR family regulator